MSNYKQKQVIPDKVLLSNGSVVTWKEALANLVVDAELSIPEEGLNVAIQDQDTDRISLYLAEILGGVTSMTGTSKDIDTFNIITDGVVPVVGNFICFQEDGKISQEEILAVTPVSGNEYTIQIDIPLDYDYTSAAACTIQNVDMNHDFDSISTEFLSGPNGDYRWDITKMLVTMILTTQGDDGKFGDLAPLVDSQYFRKEDPNAAQNLFSVKDNSDFALEGFNLTYPDRSGGLGNYGMRAEIAFNGQNNNGIVIRLDGLTNGILKSIIRNVNLTGLGKYRIKVQGHVVED